MVKDTQAKDTQVKAALGLAENVAALLCYSLGWVTGIIFFLIEKENQFVKFHAVQSTITFFALTVISFGAGFIPVLGGLVSLLIGPLGLILWIVLMYKAYQGEKFKLPFIGDIAENQVK